MWATKEDLIESNHDVEWLSKYKDICKKEFKRSELYIDSVNSIPAISLSGYRLSYDNLENVYSWHKSDGKDLVEIDSFDTLHKYQDLGYNQDIPLYGVTDFIPEGTEEELIKNVITNYPELKVFGTCSKSKYVLTLNLAVNDFRFHKNGGYRGKDNVGEHVSDSPSETYLQFGILKVKEEK
ncbi:hypothetical protein NVP1084O_154 [Vibrio phage 1.084.O._10N.261.49.F5]|nr:hypothetical protein NVP1084O_154 [Vibrio phage 1.084.O._10N.261.49.F5]